MTAIRYLFIIILIQGTPDLPASSVSTSIFVSATVSTGKTDSDNDGMTDDWERRHFGVLAQDAEKDFDGDGYSNLQEFQKNTDPRDYTLELHQDWNLISFARLPKNTYIRPEFARINVKPPIWTWDNNIMVTASEFDPLLGHWIFLENDSATIKIEKDQLQAPNGTGSYSLTLRKGWNLISIARVPKNAHIQSIFKRPDIISTIWTWDWKNGQYVLAKTLEPLRGYWVYSKTGDIQITINIKD